MTEPLVRKLDHVFVPVADPEPLFTLFTETLGLPAAWPLHDYGFMRSAGACLGNANIEFVTGDPAVMRSFAPTEPLTVRGLGFEPARPDGWGETLDERSLPHSDPVAGVGTGWRGDTGTLWTNVFVADMVAGEAVAFLNAYHVDEAIRGETASEALHACDGGVLGVQGLAEVQIGLSNLPEAQERWRRFLAPVEPDRYGRFTLSEGPAIRLRHSPIDGVQGLVLEVGSLDRAREALREHDLLGPMRRSGVGLDYAHTGGLDVWLSERR